MIKKNKSLLYYHVAPFNYNCAQSILKGFQDEFLIQQSEIEAYKANGGGKAEGGICGAVFAANRLLAQAGKPSISDEFKNVAGSIYCKDIRGVKLSCKDLVRIADDLLTESMKK
jgi:hypothetical protein